MDDKDVSEGHDDEIQGDILIPRRVAFIIDQSYSMHGPKWTKTIPSTAQYFHRFHLDITTIFSLGFNTITTRVLKTNLKQINTIRRAMKHNSFFWFTCFHYNQNRTHQMKLILSTKRWPS
eukprot:789166_1